MNIKKVIVILVLTLSAVFVTSCGNLAESVEEASNKLTIGFIPVRDADDLENDYEPIRLYLEEKLGLPIEVMITEDYASLVKEMEKEEIDIGWYGAFSYIAAESQMELDPLVAGERQDSGIYYQSLIITHKDSGINAIEDLADKRFAFVDSGSTSGFVMPYALFKSREINYEEFFSEYTYSGSHGQVPLDILEGRVDAGAISSILFNLLINEGVISKDDFSIIYQSEDIPSSPYVSRSGLDTGIKEAFTDAMINLHIELPEALHPFDESIDKYTVIESSQYNSIRNIATILGKEYMYKHFLGND